MLRKFIRWFKRVIIGEKEEEEVCETVLMPESERQELQNTSDDIWGDV